MSVALGHINAMHADYAMRPKKSMTVGHIMIYLSSIHLVQFANINIISAILDAVKANVYYTSYTKSSLMYHYAVTVKQNYNSNISAHFKGALCA